MNLAESVSALAAGWSQKLISSGAVMWRSYGRVVFASWERMGRSGQIVVGRSKIVVFASILFSAVR